MLTIADKQFIVGTFLILFGMTMAASSLGVNNHVVWLVWVLFGAFTLMGIPS